MFENIPVKIDSVGRVVIPKNIRKMYDIKSGSLLFLFLEDDGVLFVKDDVRQKLDSLLFKISKLERYGLKFIVARNDECVYKSVNDCYVSRRVFVDVLNTDDITGEVSFTSGGVRIVYYYCVQVINKNTKFLIFMYSDDDGMNDFIYTVCNLLSY